jgi:hypothetical protein
LPDDVTAHVASLVDSWTRGRRDDDVLVVMAGPMRPAPEHRAATTEAPQTEPSHVS